MSTISKQAIQLRAEVPFDLGGQRLDQVAAQLFSEHSRSRLAAWIKDGLLTVDGAVLRPRDTVHAGAVLELSAEQQAQLQRTVAVLNGGIPAVFFNGMGKANPTLDEVVAQVRAPR